MKKLKKKIFIFGKKSHNAEKTERGDPLGFFNIHSVAKYQTRRERLKSAPYLRLKKRKKLFFEKKLKIFFSKFYRIFFRKTKKMDWVARRGPLARAPGALKEGHFRNCQHFCCSWRRNPLEKKQIFEKKSHNAEKLKGIFKHPML